jgi:hypothetical protein
MSFAGSNPSLPLSRIFFVGAIVPSAFVSLDLWLIARMESGGAGAAALLLAAFVVQVGLLGILCGKFVEPAWLRWVIYAWGFALMDGVTLALASDSGVVFYWGDTTSLPTTSLLTTSLLSSQVGLVVVWAVLGNTRWLIRGPAALVLVALLAVPLAGVRYRGGDLTPLFIAQCLALLAICLVLRWKRFRLTVSEPQSPRLPSATNPMTNFRSGPLRPMQFGVRDVLTWTTSLAVVLAVARALDLLSPVKIAALFGQDWIVMLTAGFLSAIVLVVALWSALGAGRARLRWPLLAFFAPAGGLTFALLDFRAKTWNWWPTGMRRSIWNAAYRDYFYSLEWHLIAWFCLAGGLLFAALLIYRTLGYRLCHVQPAQYPTSGRA